MMRKVLLRHKSSFFVGMLRHEVGAAYSTTLCTNDNAPVRRVAVAAPQVDPASLWSNLLRDVTLARRA